MFLLWVSNCSHSLPKGILLILLILSLLLSVGDIWLEGIKTEVPGKGMRGVGSVSGVSCLHTRRGEKFVGSQIMLSLERIKSWRDNPVPVAPKPWGFLWLFEHVELNHKSSLDSWNHKKKHSDMAGSSSRMLLLRQVNFCTLIF